MEASIKDNNIKHFLRMLQCASKFGDDLHMHAHKEMWEFAVTNANKSAFFIAKLKPPFFSRYKPMGETNVEKRRGVRCALHIKSVLVVLGKATSAAIVERIDLKIIDDQDALRKKRKRQRSESHTPREEDEYEQSDDDVGGIEAKLQIKLVCRHGVTKRHSLHVGTSEFLRAEVDARSTPSSFQVSARSLRDFLDHFSVAQPGFQQGPGSIASDPHLGWLMSKKQIRMKTWETSQSNLSTEIKMDPAEFDYYWLEGDRVDFTLTMKEFRAMLALGEQLSIQLNIAFSCATQPLTISSIDDTDDPDRDGSPKYDLFCAIATGACEAFSSVKLEEQPASSSRGTSETSAQPRSASNGTTTASSRLNSQHDAAQKRKRSTLSMSTERQGRSSTNTVIGNSASGELTTSNEEQPGANGEEPLFLSNSQERSQRPRMSQREALQMAGFDDLDPDELVGALEDGEEEDERERQEEAASQRAARLDGQGGMEMGGTLAGIGTIGNGAMGGVDLEMSFEPDHGIFDQTGMDDTELGLVQQPVGKARSPDKRASSQRSVRGEGVAVEEEEDEMEEDFEESQDQSNDSHLFKTFFDD